VERRIENFPFGRSGWSQDVRTILGFDRESGDEHGNWRCERRGVGAGRRTGIRDIVTTYAVSE
jgi:hypothetical protein